MKSRDHRQKASEIFNDTHFPFANKVSFEEAFPEIVSLRMEISQSGEGTYDWDKNVVYTLENPPGEYIDCRNRICYNGGISIGSILRSMVHSKKTYEEGFQKCQGYEGSPKGRRKYRICVNSFEYKIQIEYKTEGDE